MKIIFLSIITLFLPFSFVWSQTGPYERSNKANLAQKIIHVLDNSTVSAIQTVLGAGHIVVFGILNPINDEDFGLGIHTSDDEVVQVIVKTDAFKASAYSLGLFQVGDDAHDHEGGHSVASAALGPLYLPTVALSYLLEGHKSRVMERWADLPPTEYLNTASVQVGLGTTEFQGQTANVIVMKFNIEQRQGQESLTLNSDKVFQWVNTTIVTPLLKNNYHSDLPLLVEFDLVKKRLNLIIDNVDIYLQGDQEIRNNLLTEQRYLQIESIPALRNVHIRALDWSTQYGLQYNLGDFMSITPRVGMGLSIGAFSNGS